MEHVNCFILILHLAKGLLWHMEASDLSASEGLVRNPGIYLKSAVRCTLWFAAFAVTFST